MAAIGPTLRCNTNLAVQAKSEVKATIPANNLADSTIYQPSNAVPVNLSYTTNITFTPAFTTYLPLVVNLPAGIYGRVTYQGNPIGGIELTLQWFVASDFYTVLTTTTQSDGSYMFTNAPDLAPSTGYAVRYMNDGNPQYLGYYYSTFLGYSQGPGGDFDIANIVSVSLPIGNCRLALHFSTDTSP